MNLICYLIDESPCYPDAFLHVLDDSVACLQARIVVQRCPDLRTDLLYIREEMISGAKKIEITIIPHMADVSTTRRVNGAKRVVSLSSNFFANSANFYQWLCLDCMILQKSFENQCIPMVSTLCMVALFVRPS